MPFLIETFDKPDSLSLRKQWSAAHQEFLDQHQTLLLAGGDKQTDDGKRALGGIYLVDVATRQDAAALIAQDPFSIADLFERVTILRWAPSYLGRRAIDPGRRRPVAQAASNP